MSLLIPKCESLLVKGLRVVLAKSLNVSMMIVVTVVVVVVMVMVVVSPPPDTVTSPC